ncbi:MAG: hypothetical protein SGJ23_14030 [Alphaproteobacteria bacterium]|nr:hypothetical protein [Alphaproteobacteria bacterium]
MLPPYVYEEARMTATEHVQVEVVRVGRPAATEHNPHGDHGLCRVDGRVAQVFRGRLRVGEQVVFEVSCATRDARVPVGGTLWTDMHALTGARVLEGFFNREGGRLAVARDQIEIVPMVRALPYCGPPKGECVIPAQAKPANPLVAWWESLFPKR